MTSLHSVDISIKKFLLGVRRENMKGNVAKAKKAFQINLSVVFDCICDMGFNILHDLEVLSMGAFCTNDNAILCL